MWAFARILLKDEVRADAWEGCGLERHVALADTGGLLLDLAFLAHYCHRNQAEG